MIHFHLLTIIFLLVLHGCWADTDRSGVRYFEMGSTVQVQFWVPRPVRPDNMIDDSDDGMPNFSFSKAFRNPKLYLVGEYAFSPAILSDLAEFQTHKKERPSGSEKKTIWKEIAGGLLFDYRLDRKANNVQRKKCEVLQNPSLVFDTANSQRYTGRINMDRSKWPVFYRNLDKSPVVFVTSLNDASTKTQQEKNVIVSKSRGGSRDIVTLKLRIPSFQLHPPYSLSNMNFRFALVSAKGKSGAEHLVAMSKDAISLKADDIKTYVEEGGKVGYGRSLSPFSDRYQHRRRLKQHVSEFIDRPNQVTSTAETESKELKITDSPETLELLLKLPPIEFPIISTGNCSVLRMPRVRKLADMNMNADLRASGETHQIGATWRILCEYEERGTSVETFVEWYHHQTCSSFTLFSTVRNGIVKTTEPGKVGCSSWSCGLFGPVRKNWWTSAHIAVPEDNFNSFIYKNTPEIDLLAIDSQGQYETTEVNKNVLKVRFSKKRLAI